MEVVEGVLTPARSTSARWALPLGAGRVLGSVRSTSPRVGVAQAAALGSKSLAGAAQAAVSSPPRSRSSSRPALASGPAAEVAVPPLADLPEVRVAAAGSPPAVCSVSIPIRGSKSFRDVMSTDAVAFRAPSIVNGVPALLFSPEEIESLSKPFARTLIGKIATRPPPLFFIRAFFKSLKLEGQVFVDYLNDRAFAFRFSHEMDYNRFFIKRCIDIRGAVFSFFKWSPTLDVSEESPLIPVWISLLGLRLHYHARSVLWSIGKMFGNPLQVDAGTANNARLHMARILVEMDITTHYPSQIWLGAEGCPDVGYFQPVEMENFPAYCTSCSSFSHASNSCVSVNIQLPPVDDVLPVPEVPPQGGEVGMALGSGLVASDVCGDSSPAMAPICDDTMFEGSLVPLYDSPVVINAVSSVPIATTSHFVEASAQKVKSKDSVGELSSGVRGISGTPSQPVVEIDVGVAPLPAVVFTGQSTEGCSAEMEVAGSHSGVKDLGAGVVDLGGVHNELEFLADVPRFDLDIDYDSAPAALALRRRKGRGKNKKYDFYSMTKSKSVKSAPRA